MSMENVTKFYEALSTNEELQAKVKAENEKYAGQTLSAEEKAKIFEEAILPLAEEAGYPFTMAELKAFEEANVGKECSDDELAAVAGGKTIFDSSPTTLGVCFFIGAGIGNCYDLAGGSFCLLVGWG